MQNLSNKTLAIFLFFLMLTFPVFGEVQVTDGDTIILQGQKIRLDGIDAPEKNQLCQQNKEPWLCGREATKALKTLLENTEAGSVKCEGSTRDRYKRLIGTCYYKDLNVNEWMVENGWAMAYRFYSKRYVPNEIQAQENKFGIWRGEFVPPWDWRKGKRLATLEEAPRDCTIKGNILSKGGKIYHVPGGAYNSRTKINKAKGELYFCSEEEAIQKGWTKSKR